LVSVWQYLKASPKDLLKELGRTMKEPKRLFIISEEGFENRVPGEEKMEFRAQQAEGIEEEIRDLGYNIDSGKYIPFQSRYNWEMPEYLHCLSVRL
jgi:hypothetical protein